jgi:predicted DCC family thiol-disulfide oxidoreductase YuxK
VPSDVSRPTLIFDGDCSFCRIWVDFWRTLTGDRVDYRPATEPLRAVEYISPDGRFTGAAAVVRLLGGVSGYEWMLRVYRNLPGFAPLAELLYRLVAAHREAGYRVTRALLGERVERPTYHQASGIFVRALAFIYLVAFASFGMQARGLIGSDGILPVNMYFRFATAQLGNAAKWKVPSIFWWAQSDFALLSIAWGGVALAAIATLARPFSVWQRGIFAILFFYYLSIVSAGQIFMSYQWDLLLLEAGFLAIFLRPSLPRVWLYQWLLFRLMFESGIVKLTSHDPTWHNLTALSFHYETQPLPTIFAWFAAKLPLWFQMASTAMVFAIELALPFLIFGPRRLKQAAAFGFIGLQLLIFITGNYTFFNILAIAFCLFLFDDAFFAWKKKYVPVPPARSNRFVSAALLLFVMTASCIQLAEMLGAPQTELEAVLRAEEPFGLVNQYGLFAVMTTTRPEIEVEGSNDSVNWQPYVFRYKAGPLNRAPGWVAPFQPRLDWQMWFAALGSYRDNPWFVRFLLKLLEGSRPVQALMERDPFGGVPPKHIRAMVYEYHFTTIEEWRRTGNWWRREFKGAYFPPVSLKGANGP